MKTQILAVLFVVFSSAVFSQTVVAQDAIVKKLAGDFKFTEGPAADKDGSIYFTDIPNNRIQKWSVEGVLSTFLENSRGANGLYFDKDGNLIACASATGQIVSIDPAGAITVLAESYKGKPFNSPNDLWLDSKGGIYFTDPRYGPRENLPQDGEHVYYISPDHSKVTRVISDFVRPNGIIGTDEGKLYVADPGAGQTFVYHINPEGALAEKKPFVSQGSDGMVLDERGNLYLTGDAVTVYDPSGQLIQTIDVPEKPSNLCFGGKDKKTLFITARTSLYSLQMQVAGVSKSR